MHRLAIPAVLAVLLAASACAQDADHIDPATVLKWCGKTNPPPCATTPPKAIHMVDPEIPKGVRHIQGTVVLELVVGTDGRAHNIEVVRSLGHELDQAAIEAIRKWKFQPGTNHGVPVPVAITFQTEFHTY